MTRESLTSAELYNLYMWVTSTEKISICIRSDVSNVFVYLLYYFGATESNMRSKYLSLQ